MGTSPQVAVFATNFGAKTQTFIWDEVTRLRSWEASVFCRIHHNRPHFPFPRVHEAGLPYLLSGRSTRFDRAFAQTNFSLVHAHFGPAAAYAAGFARRHKLPLTAMFHGYDLPLLRNRRRWLPYHWPYTLRARQMLAQLDLAFCASEELREMIVALGVPFARTTVHRLGIDTARFSPGDKPTEGPLQVLLIGRLVEKKGFSDALRALALAAPRATRSFQVEVLGDGPLRERLEGECAQLCLQDRVRFAGYVTHAEVAARLRNAHLILTPSVVTPSGDRDSGLMVLREACAAGVVPIATRHGGLPDSIDEGHSGYLVDEHDVQGMASHLVELANTPARLQAMAKAGRTKMIREFGIDERNAALEAEFTALTDRSG